MKAVAKTLGVARSNLVERLKDSGRPRQRYGKAEDAALLPRVRLLVDERPTYGYRRITALLNRALAREGWPRVNHKRVYRLMQIHGLLLAKHTGHRQGRSHDGKVVVMASNLRPRRSPDRRSCGHRIIRLLADDGVRTAWSSHAGMDKPSGLPLSWTPMTERSSPGRPSLTPAYPAPTSAT